MCGICGIYNEKNKEVITDMLNAIRHRGPDSFNVLLHNNSSLAECGLNIVSGEKDKRPLTNESGIVLLFNGEIYNYRLLRENLKKEGYSFKSDTDSEVILKLYEHYKEEFVEHLKGMYAIAILDGNKLILARDKFGIKPLFYFQNNSKLIFGSELKSVLQHPEVPAEIDESSLQELFIFGYFLSEGRTILNNINQIPPGHILTFEGNKMQKRRYYDMPLAFYSNGRQENYSQIVSEISNSLLNTISMFHQHGRHPKGIYLSGGIDSSLMAVLSKEVLNDSIQTFTLYDSKSAKDYSYAKKVAKAIGANHHEFEVTLDDYFKELPHFIHHYENIVAGGVFDIQGSVAFQILSKHISDHVKIAFTGEGADELFGGYYWIYTHPLGFSDRIRERAKTLDKSSHVHDLINYVFPQPEDERNYRKNLFDLLMRAGLFNYHLWSVDRSCSSFGFETRPPYMYDEIVDLSLSVPIDYKVPDKKITKMILKDIALPYLEKYGIQEVASREKYGMPAALDSMKPKIQNTINRLVSKVTLNSHPFRQYLKTPTDVLMFDLFYFLFIIQRGKYPSDFSIFDFYKGQLNEHMYN
jgi:asparagine synthase (glutamine-hydrolysing)